MSRSLIGVLLALTFVVTEAIQTVYFGGLFQSINSFLFGFLLFGLIVIGFAAWTAVFAPHELRLAFQHRRQLFMVNLGAMVTFTAFLLSVQLIEPAISYTLSAGVVPLTAYVLYKSGVREGEDMRNGFEAFGNCLILLGVIFLSLVTLLDMSGFVRGSTLAAFAGIALAMVDGVFFTVILVYSQRLSKVGVGPGAVLAVRLPLYLLTTGLLAAATVNISELPDASTIATALLLGLLVTVPPLYCLQKAIPLVSTLTISALTALGPIFIFALQLVEGRVDYSTPSLIGLCLYTAGALVAAFGAVQANARGA